MKKQDPHKRPEKVEELTFNIQELKNAERIFKVINNQQRMEILKLIHRAGHITVMAIYTELKIPQPVASQQLARLRKAGLVNNHWKNRTLYYFIEYNRLGDVYTNARQLADL